MNATLLATTLLFPCSDMKGGTSARTLEPFVIDFAPATACNGTLYNLQVHFKGGETYRIGEVFWRNMTATEIRDFVHNDNRNRLCVKTIGKTKLAIYMDMEGNPVTAVMVIGVEVIVTPKNSYREER